MNRSSSWASESAPRSRANSSSSMSLVSWRLSTASISSRSTGSSQQSSAGRACRQRPHLFVREPDCVGEERDVDAPLVLAPAAGGDAIDHDLALPLAEAQRAAELVAAPAVHRGGHRHVAGERAEQTDRIDTGRHHPGELLLDVRFVRRGERFDACHGSPRSRVGRVPAPNSAPALEATIADSGGVGEHCRVAGGERPQLGGAVTRERRAVHQRPASSGPRSARRSSVGTRLGPERRGVEDRLGDERRLDDVVLGRPPGRRRCA